MDGVICPPPVCPKIISNVLKLNRILLFRHCVRFCNFSPRVCLLPPKMVLVPPLHKVPLYWEHAWSSGKAQDSWSLDHQCCEFEPRYGQRVCVPGQDTKSQFASLTRAHLGPVGCGEYYNLSADRACTWPVANRPRWSEMIVTISWRGNDKGNSALYH